MLRLILTSWKKDSDHDRRDPSFTPTKLQNHVTPCYRYHLFINHLIVLIVKIQKLKNVNRFYYDETLMLRAKCCKLSRLLPRTLVTSVCFCFVFVDSVVFCQRQHFLHEHSRHSVTFISPLILWWNTCRLNVSMKCKIISLFFKSRKIKRTCNNSNIKQL